MPRYLSEIEKPIESVASGVEDEAVRAGRSSLPEPSKKRQRTVDRLAAMEERIQRVEVAVADSRGMFDEFGQCMEELESEDKNELRKEMHAALVAIDCWRHEIDEFKWSLLTEFSVIKDELAMIRVNNKRGMAPGGVKPKVKLDVPKPQPYGGSRNAKEVDNFLFTLERYFEGAGIEEDSLKLSQAPLYFKDSATTWWRMKK